MKMTKAFVPTLKESPAEAEVASHRLMIRAGLIRRLSAGTYIYLPLGLRVLRKVESIVRQEMDNAGALELLMPAIHPKELWEKTGRFALLGEILITYKDRHGKINLLGPTHEEVITDLAAREIRSYRDLPRTLYQIQTKFRDEPRPRFGVLRSKEFIMKDAYSFDRDQEGLNKSYQAMYDAYCRIFKRCGLTFIAVEADTGFMGGDVSHEFMIPAKSGEDVVALCPACGYAASAAMAACPAQKSCTVDFQKRGSKVIREVNTPGVSTVEKVSALLKVKPEQLIKTLIYKADDKPAAILIRGDHSLNEAKLSRHLGCRLLQMADDRLIKRVTGGPVGFSGPVGLTGVRIIADHSVAGMGDCVTGANKADAHLVDVNIGRDFTIDEWADLRYIEKDDQCPTCRKKKIKLENAIEAGHTFKLGTKYSKDLNATFLDQDGRDKPCIMGCYGIGVNRIIAAAIEQNNDKDGIIWPLSLAPYQVVILPLNMAHRETAEIAEGLYEELSKQNIEAMLDDRPVSAGIKFKDAELIGFPLQVIIGEKGLAKKKIELKTRKDKKVQLLSKQEVAEKIKKKIKGDVSLAPNP